jgi:beta-glucosidase
VNHDLVYESGPTIGYRHFDRNAITPRFAFGHGLGYTSFSMDDLGIERTGPTDARVALTVRNTGRRAGKEVVQVYIRAPSGVGTGARELKAYTPVWLEPGASQRVELVLGARAFRHWQAGHGWAVTPGEYEVFAGRSSVELPLRARLTIA